MWKQILRLFIKPKTAGFIFSLLGGILLTISLELILRILDNSIKNIFGHTQIIGVFIFLSSICFFISAFLMEDFQDHLKDKKKEKDEPEERIYQLVKWPQKSFFIVILFLNLLFVLVSIILCMIWH